MQSVEGTPSSNSFFLIDVPSLTELVCWVHKKFLHFFFLIAQILWECFIIIFNVTHSFKKHKLLYSYLYTEDSQAASNASIVEKGKAKVRRKNRGAGTEEYGARDTAQTLIKSYIYSFTRLLFIGLNLKNKILIDRSLLLESILSLFILLGREKSSITNTS